jgi:hypothetical protein
MLVGYARVSTTDQTLDLQHDGHRQVVGCLPTRGTAGRAARDDTRNYAAMATPVTSAQMVKAWSRAVRNLAAVSWLGRREKTLAI